MELRPFEIVAACELRSLPTGQDIADLTARLERARAKVSAVVSATPQPPAIYRNLTYVLETRCVAWANTAEEAAGLVRRLLDEAGVPCRSVYRSGRALAPTDVPRPEAPAPQTRGRRTRAPALVPAAKGRSRAARVRVQGKAASRGTRKGASARKAGSRR
ncbi:MAG: hypothetical protein QN187_13160 [Armatimonadota bacterium]|nr:hypothetical protein [Armatimonadota bacterium]MDR7518524.1 hypothetical protein [Armatimonadota bacterium]MDR7550430.1 hypothetical protein [Armatimonadota bacterium]